MRFPGMNSGAREGPEQKKPHRSVGMGGAGYLSVRHRPGYSSSGCTPAEPDSASPGTMSIAHAGVASGGHQPRITRNDGFVASRTGPGGRALRPGGRSRHRKRDGSTRYQASTDRRRAKTDSGASTARSTRIEGRRRHRRRRAGVPPMKPPVGNATNNGSPQGGAKRNHSKDITSRPACTVRANPMWKEKQSLDLTRTAS
jgi:hypothetical protein